MFFEFYIKVFRNINDVGFVLIEVVFKSCINKLCFINMEKKILRKLRIFFKYIK